jgi:hypothetical protein
MSNVAARSGRRANARGNPLIPRTPGVRRSSTCSNDLPRIARRSTIADEVVDLPAPGTPMSSIIMTQVARLGTCSSDLRIACVRGSLTRTRMPGHSDIDVFDLAIGVASRNRCISLSY